VEVNLPVHWLASRVPTVVSNKETSMLFIDKEINVFSAEALNGNLKYSRTQYYVKLVQWLEQFLH